MPHPNARRRAIEDMLRKAWLALYGSAAWLAPPAILEQAGRTLTLIAMARLNEKQAEVVWARAALTPWKVLAHRSGVSEDTLQRRYVGALAEICGAQVAIELSRRARKPVNRRAA